MDNIFEKAAAPARQPRPETGQTTEEYADFTEPDSHERLLAEREIDGLFAGYSADLE